MSTRGTKPPSHTQELQRDTTIRGDAKQLQRDTSAEVLSRFSGFSLSAGSIVDFVSKCGMILNVCARGPPTHNQLTAQEHGSETKASSRPRTPRRLTCVEPV